MYLYKKLRKMAKKMLMDLYSKVIYTKKVNVCNFCVTRTPKRTLYIESSIWAHVIGAYLWIEDYNPNYKNI